MNSKGEFSGFLLGGVNSGSGKTTLALALMRAFARRGLAVAPFKCGPDYIDPSFHRQAAGRPSANLDTFFLDDRQLEELFRRRATDCDMAIVEGVMGLFDGTGSDFRQGSSAEIALKLELPVILVVNARGLSGSIAPLVKGFADWNPQLRIAGVIADFTGSAAHAEILARTLETAQLPPLLGYLQRNDCWRLPERHLGLSTGPLDSGWLDALAEEAERTIDLDQLLALTRRPQPEPPPVESLPPVQTRLGVARDAAFQFHYEENFELLRKFGVATVDFSPLADSELPPELDGLWFGGGYPELYAEQLASNTSLLEAIRDFAGRNRPIYGECGGYLYLAETLTDLEGRSHRMTALLPGHATMNRRLAALGYRELVTTVPGIFGPPGTPLRGHEFHYSTMELPAGGTALFDATDPRGRGFRAGTVSGRVSGSYIHLALASNPTAARHFAGELAK